MDDSFINGIAVGDAGDSMSNADYVDLDSSSGDAIITGNQMVMISKIGISSLQMRVALLY